MWHVPIFELAIRKLQEVFSSSTLVIELYLKINCWTLPTHSCSPRKRASSYLSFKKPHKSTCMIDLQIFEWRKDKCQVTHNNCPWLIHFIPDHVQFPSFFLGLGFHESRITDSTSSIQLSMEMHEPSKFIIMASILPSHSPDLRSMHRADHIRLAEKVSALSSSSKHESHHPAHLLP